MAALRARAKHATPRLRLIRHLAEWLVMELEAEEFEDIVRGLGEKPPGINATRGDPERRRADRVAVAAGVVLAAHGVAAPQPRQVQLRCLSRSGIAVFDRLL